MIFISVQVSYHQDNVLIEEKLRQDVFRDSPKRWLNYTDAFLNKTLYSNYLGAPNRCGGRSYVSSIVYFEKYARNFCFDVSTNVALPYPTIDYQRYLHLTLLEQNVTEPLRIIKLHIPEYPTIKLHLNLALKLSLNITFYYIHIWGRHASECFVGKIIVVGQNKGTSSSFNYCGIHPTLISYPPGHLVDLIFKRNFRFGTLETTLFFTVLDENIIFSVAFKRTRFVRPSWILYIPNRECFLLRFYLKTEKYKTLTISSSLELNIYDGPGILSPVLRTTKRKYVTSTFQCVSVVWLSTLEHESFQNHLNMSSELKPVDKNFSIISFLRQNISLSLKNPCVIVTSGEEFSYKYLTINNLTYKGYNDGSCTYAGLTVYSLINKSYVEASSECFSHNGFYKYRNIYSKSNQLLFVLYSYKEYGKLTINITLSSTYCKPVSVNLCALNYLCLFPGNKMCQEFKSEVQQFPHVNYSSTLGFFPFLRFSVDANECFILQMIDKIDTLEGSPPDICFMIEIGHTPIHQENILLHYHVRGFLRGMITTFCVVMHHTEAKNYNFSKMEICSFIF